MAPKRPTPFEDPPSASSSDEEEEVASDDDVVASDEEVEEEVPHAEEAEQEDEDEEEEEEEEMAVNGAPAVPKPVAQRESSDSDESGDDLPVVMKQKTSKHVVDEKKKKKASSKMETVVQKPVVEHESSDSDETDDSQLNSGTVKPVDAVNPAAKPLVTNGKKRKKSESELTECEEKKPGENSKKHKVFRGEGEEELLKGMSYFVSKHGKDIMSDQDGFYEYLKKELDVEFSKAQLIAKARNLKKKFKKNDKKVKNGEELKPREHKLYELSKIIWDGGEPSNGRSHVSNEEKIVMFEKKDDVSDSEMDDTESDDTESDDTTMNHLVKLLSEVHSGFGLSEEYVRSGLSLIGKTERVKMAKQWEKLLIDETELMLKRIELRKEQVKLALDALRASSH